MSHKSLIDDHQGKEYPATYKDLYVDANVVLIALLQHYSCTRISTHLYPNLIRDGTAYAPMGVLPVTATILRNLVLSTHNKRNILLDIDMHRDTPRVVIVGAGIAGITMAVNLRNKLHHDNFIIYEKAGSIGGTWRENTYPGCGSDIPGHWYCLSTEPNPYWENYYITQPEIRAYWEEIYRKHDLPSRTVFNTRVKLVEWDEENGVHNLTLEDAMSGQIMQTQAEAVIQAVGFFTTPTYPDISGMDKFTGPLWHSSQWRHDVDLKGMTVGVIGNGCSA